MIERCRDAFPVRMMCTLMGVSPSGFYSWLHRMPSKRAQANTTLLHRIEALHGGSGGALGRRRICEDLRDEGETVSVNRVGRIMQKAGLAGCPQKKRRPPGRRSKRHDHVVNHLARDFSATAPNERWVTDITYIRTYEHWLYLCVVIDLYSREVVGWSMSAQQNRQLVIQAVLMALWQRPSGESVILHSDRGTQFTSDEYQRFLKGHQVVSSMSAVGSCEDNALCEGFFGMLKRERVRRQTYPDHAAARADVFAYIERFYNPRMRRRVARKATITLNQTVRKNGA